LAHRGHNTDLSIRGKAAVLFFDFRNAKAMGFAVKRLNAG